MKKNILIAFGITLLFSGIFAQSQQSFPDVKINDWFYQYVESIKDWGIINGQGDGTFAPEKGINRAEFSKMIYLYDQRVDEKIEQKIPEISAYSRANLPSVLYMHSYDKESPAECPDQWSEVDFRRTWRNEYAKYTWKRTCVIEKECRTMHLESYNEDSNECPMHWTEADFKQTDRDGSKRQYTRTCYICE